MGLLPEARPCQTLLCQKQTQATDHLDQQFDRGKSIDQILGQQQIYYSDLDQGRWSSSDQSIEEQIPSDILKFWGTVFWLRVRLQFRNEYG